MPIEVQCNTGGLLVVGKNCMKPMGPVKMQRPHSFLVAVSYMELNTCTFFISITRCIIHVKKRLCLLYCSVDIYLKLKLIHTLSVDIIIIFFCSKTLR